MGDEWEAQIADARTRILASVPHCLSHLVVNHVVTPVEDDGELITSFHTACKCGSQIGRLLGYSLEEFNASYDGDLEFVRPLYFECSVCRTAELIIDEHGYNCEVARLEGGVGSATYRGTGENSRFLCHHCNNDVFSVTLTFIYSEGAFDLFVDKPELPAVDFFDIFEARGECSSCHRNSLIASFEG